LEPIADVPLAGNGSRRDRKRKNLSTVSLDSGHRQFVAFEKRKSQLNFTSAHVLWAYLASNPLRSRLRLDRKYVRFNELEVS
jgi:hypothetical protein